ncbi:MAG: xanthine dehydrogenase family protein molybdopterin-binding subunit [Crocosphaera sp.]|nr:xanthine dehydrogenase family protein molybdopterin-binding subunit [Crocosphaera sp.]
MKQKTTRRIFLQTSTAVGVGFALGFYIPPNKKAMAATKGDPSIILKPNAFIRIAADNTVTLIIHKAEMGQGVYTSLPMIIVEELEADWDTIKIESAPVDPDYNHTIWKAVQGTGGSTSVSSTWEQLRLAGATAREMLIMAAAQTWEVSPDSCRAEKSYVIHSPTKRRLSFGALAEKASQIPVPENVTLKTPDRFKLIGKSIKRLDTPDKVRAKASFGIDVEIPGMLSAVIARPPVFGSRLKNLDSEAAKSIPGVKYVVPLEVGGVAVVAEHFWAAKKGRDALKIEWSNTANDSLSSESLRQKYAQLAKKPGLIARKVGQVKEALSESKQRLEAVYETPYLAHAPMEPLNCIADVRADSCEIWTGTQMQTTDQQAACAITGLKPEQVKIHTTLLGGSFGRRANPHGDFVKEAVHLSKAISQPVKVLWTREDDIKGGYYRPMHYSKISAGLDENGNVNAWCHRLIGESIVEGTIFEAALFHEGIDHLSIEGAADHPYAIPNQLVDHHAVKNNIPVLWWRSVGHSFTSFVVESFLDELAHLAQRDPVEFRLAMLEEYPRHQATLKLAAQQAGWGKQTSNGIYQGVALHKSFGSIVAQIAEVSLNDQGKPHLERVVCAVDCGLVLNPSTVRDQVQSGIVYGLSAALYGQITFQQGRVQQNNFHDYQVLRMNEMPKIEVYLVNSGETQPYGVGEISTPPIAPALCNAIFAATGERVRQLPIRL